MENLTDYTIRKKIKINGTNVTVFFRDEESTPVFSFSELIRAVFGEDNAGVNLLIKQIPEDNKTNLVNATGNSQWVVDFDGLSFFIQDKMEEHFANTTINNVKRFLDREVQQLPSPVKVSRKLSVQERDENFDCQYIVATDDNRPQRYVKVRGVRWFNGIDLRTNYCGSSQDYFEYSMLEVKPENCFQSTVGDAGMTIFVNEPGMLEFLRESNPDDYQGIYERLIERCQQTVLEQDDVLAEEDKEEPKPLELSQVYKQRKDSEEAETISDYTWIRTCSTKEFTVSWITGDNDTVYVKIKDVEDSQYLNPLQNKYQGARKKFKFENGNYLGEFASYKDIVNFVDANRALEFTDRFEEQINPQIEQVVIEDPVKKEDKDMNIKHYTDKPIPGRVADWTELNMNGIPVFTVIIKNESEEFQPLFRANDIGAYAGFSNATALTRNKVDENLYTNVSIGEIRRNNVRVLSLEGVESLIRVSGKFDDETVNILVNDLNSAAQEYINANLEQIKFFIEKWDAEDKIKEEDTVNQQEDINNISQEELKEKASEVVQNALNNPEITEKLNGAMPGLGAMAAGLLGGLMNNNNGVDTQNEYSGTVFVNEKPIRAIIARSPSGGITPFYCTEDFCKVWGLDTDKVKSHLTDSTPKRVEQDGNGDVTYLSYADLSALVSFENTAGRTMVSNTMKLSGDLFEEACKNFGIDFKNDTQNTESKEEAIDTQSADSMEQFLSHAENGHAYTVGAIILAERIRNVLAFLKNRGSNIEIGLPGPTSNSLVKRLWMFIDTQDPQKEVNTAFQQTVITANERYRYLLNVAQSLK